MYPSNIAQLPALAKRVQVDYRINCRKCAHLTCDVFLAWNEHGQENAEGDFKVESCTCDYPTVCCTDNVKTHICMDCIEGLKTYDANLLSEENARLKKRLRQYENE